jgi:hypothetical protein
VTGKNVITTPMPTDSILTTKKQNKTKNMSYTPLNEGINEGGRSHTIVCAAADLIYSSALSSSLQPKELSEPLNYPLHENDIEVGIKDPFFVFREDLRHRLDLVDQALVEYLRLVHQSVRLL